MDILVPQILPSAAAASSVVLPALSCIVLLAGELYAPHKEHQSARG